MFADITKGLIEQKYMLQLKVVQRADVQLLH